MTLRIYFFILLAFIALGIIHRIFKKEESACKYYGRIKDGRNKELSIINFILKIFNYTNIVFGCILTLYNISMFILPNSNIVCKIISGCLLVTEVFFLLYEKVEIFIDLFETLFF